MSARKPPFWRAVHHFWLTRQGQADDQVQRGVKDQGSRGAVTGGRQLDGFLLKMTERLTDARVPLDTIFTEGRSPEIPGYYRPNKLWDLIVVEDGQLFAAVELKSQVGSLGNNANNRFEEAIGNAVDFYRAYQEGAFECEERPWVGYLFLLAPRELAERERRLSERHFPVIATSPTASYADRLRRLCESLEAEKLYDATCPLLTDETEMEFRRNYSEISGALGAERFLDRLVKGVRGRRRKAGLR